MKNSHRTWIEIDSKAFNHNMSKLRNFIDSPTVLGVVVKADAYGHGLELMGKLCQENSNVSWLFTAGITEAVCLRKQGVTKPILVLAYVDDDIEYLVEYDITYTLADMHTAHMLSKSAQHMKKTISVHLEIDTGMSRLGFKQDEHLPNTIKEILRLEGICIKGIFTHLSDTNNSDYFFTKNQLKRFDIAAHAVEVTLGKKLFKHALASGALHISHEYSYDGVRIGSNAYGIWKSPLQQQRILALNPELELRPLLTWKTRIIDVKHISAGDAVGYHRTFIAPKAMKIAILPIGYSDGYPRGLSHKAGVLVRGSYTPIVGIISMNLMVIDVSAVGSVRIDDEVVLCGDFPGITPEDLAIVTDSLHLEFLARISPSIPRIVV
ncbi:MAG: alanine racemase [Candidatus Babeliaceae bacterium]|nr:alanine racemase [Candidatus Babeliaceae bacterium]